jgi:hypothetical protein
MGFWPEMMDDVQNISHDHLNVFVTTLWRVFDFQREEKTSRYSKKIKATPVKAWAGPEVSRRLRPPDLKTIGT